MTSIWSPTPQVSYPEVVGAVLAKRREFLELSQAALARVEGVDMSQAPIGKIELGKTICAVDHLFKLAPALGLKPSDILSEADAHVAAAREFGFEVVPAFKELKGAIDGDSAFRLLRPMIFPTIILGPKAWAILHVQLNVWDQVFKKIDLDSHEAHKLRSESQGVTWDVLGRVMLECYEHREYKEMMKKLTAEFRVLGRDINDEEVAYLVEESKQADIDELIRAYDRLAAESSRQEFTSTMNTIANVLRLPKKER